MIASILQKYDACDESIEWVGKRRSAKAAWDACERGDWLLWIAARIGVERKLVVFAACQCARLALPYTADPRVLACIETTERWTRGRATSLEVDIARRAACTADTYATYAAEAAAEAATEAATYATYAARFAAEAATWAADNARVVRASTLKKCAVIVRKNIPWSAVAKALKKSAGGAK